MKQQPPKPPDAPTKPDPSSTTEPTSEHPSKPVAKPSGYAGTKSPFEHLERLRISQSFEQGLPVKEHIATIPIRKPNRQEFIRCSPDLFLETLLIVLKEQGEYYLPDPSLWAKWGHEASRWLLIPYTTRRGGLFIWPLRAPDMNGRTDRWAQSALEAYECAKTKWVRLQADMHLGAYRILIAVANDDPEWPDMSFEKMLEIAFRDRVISTEDHPVLRALKGEL